MTEKAIEPSMWLCTECRHEYPTSGHLKIGEFEEQPPCPKCEEKTKDQTDAALDEMESLIADEEPPIEQGEGEQYMCTDCKIPMIDSEKDGVRTLTCLKCGTSGVVPPKLQSVPAPEPGTEEEEEQEVTASMIARTLMIRYGDIAIALADRLAQQVRTKKGDRGVSPASMMDVATRIMLMEQVSLNGSPQAELAFLQLQAIKQPSTGLVVPAGTQPIVADPR